MQQLKNLLPSSSLDNHDNDVWFLFQIKGQIKNNQFIIKIKVNVFFFNTEQKFGMIS